MKVNRRTALRQFAFITAGVALIPSCMQDKSKSAILLKNMNVKADQEKMLEEISETIIPKTDTPGAKDISAHLFALKMVDDCFKKEDQQRFIKGMIDFERLTSKKFDKSFVDCTPVERTALLHELEQKKEAKDDLSYFYGTTKRLTIQAYTSSKYYLTKVQVYELVPSRYHGCVPVKPLQKKNA